MLGSVFTIEATARPGVTPEQLEKAIDEQLALLQQNGPTQDEVDRARNRMVSGIIRGLESLGGFGGIADRLNGYNHYLGDAGLPAAGYRPLSRRSRRRACGRSASRDAGEERPGRRLRRARRTRNSTTFRRAEPRRSTPAVAGAAAPDWRATPPGAGPASPVETAGAGAVQAGQWPDGDAVRAAQAAGGVGESRAASPAATAIPLPGPGSRPSPPTCSTRERRRAATCRSREDLAGLGAMLERRFDHRLSAVSPCAH